MPPSWSGRGDGVTSGRHVSLNQLEKFFSEIAHGLGDQTTHEEMASPFVPQRQYIWRFWTHPDAAMI